MPITSPPQTDTCDPQRHPEAGAEDSAARFHGTGSPGARFPIRWQALPATLAGIVLAASAGRRWKSMAMVAVLCGCAATVAAQTVGGPWVLRGPAPAHGGDVEQIANLTVSGAIEAIAPHPTNAGIVTIAAVNGGIWRTSNATAADPTWTKVSADLGTTSFGAIAYDPTDTGHQTLVAGTSRVSAYGGRGGSTLGVVRSTDGGLNWVLLNPGGPLAAHSITGLAARGSTLVAATPNGIYRSTNTGASFTLLSGAAGSGLPSGNASDLVGVPGAAQTLYAALVSGTRGVWRSTNSGATWSKVSDAAVDGVFNAGAGSPRARLATGPSGQVFVGIVGADGRLAEVFRSPDGTTWTALGVPLTTEQNGTQVGIHPAGQGRIHFSIAADPTDTNIVYVGGDRQPTFGELVPGSTQFFPNSLGALTYSGRLFRGNASLPTASRWSALTHSGTSNNSAPHADSRAIVFDAAGTMLQADDGGIYRRSSPRTATGSWSSAIGNLAVTEFHGIAWDAVSSRVVGGSQDNGSPEQRDASTVFDLVSVADGGDVAVEDLSSTTQSTRYTSFQFLDVFRRRIVNGSNAVANTAFPALAPTAGSPALVPEFYTPIATNGTGGNRIVIGARNGLYESTNRGDTVTRISTLQVTPFEGDPLVYGVPGNPDYLLFGAGAQIHRRTAAAGAITSIATLPATVGDLTVDRLDPTRMFAITASQVFYSSAATPSFNSVTGNLPTYSPGVLRSVAHASAQGALLVGSDRGVFVSYQGSGYSTWFRIGTGLPNAPVYELEFDPTDQLLLAGLLGRGAWTLASVPVEPNLLFANGFEP